MSILILCHGNVCRSPLAAAVMRKAGLTDITSAGFKPAEENGKKSPKKMRDWAAANGYDLTEHRSQAVTKEMLEAATLILYMDSGQYGRLETLWDDWGMTALRGPMDPLVRPLGAWLTPPSARIADPNFQRPETQAFITIMHQLVEASTRFAAAWQAKTPTELAQAEGSAEPVAASTEEAAA